MARVAAGAAHCQADLEAEHEADFRALGAAVQAPSEIPSAPTDEQISQGASKSTVEHSGHGDNDPKTNGGGSPSPIPSQSGTDLAETGGSGATPVIAIGGAGVLAVGAAVLFGLARRRATPGRHGR